MISCKAYDLHMVQLMPLIISRFFKSRMAYLSGTSLPRLSLKKLECGPMPNLMVALPNTGGALCSTPQSLADAHY